MDIKTHFHHKNYNQWKLFIMLYFFYFQFYKCVFLIYNYKLFSDVLPLPSSETDTGLSTPPSDIASSSTEVQVKSLEESASPGLHLELLSQLDLHRS